MGLISYCGGRTAKGMDCGGLMGWQWHELEDAVFDCGCAGERPFRDVAAWICLLRIGPNFTRSSVVDQTKKCMKFLKFLICIGRGTIHPSAMNSLAPYS